MSWLYMYCDLWVGLDEPQWNLTFWDKNISFYSQFDNYFLLCETKIQILAWFAKSNYERVGAEKGSVKCLDVNRKEDSP